LNELLQLLLVVAAILVLSKLAGALSQRIGQPSVFGELLMGLILGPTVLNFLDWPVFSHREEITVVLSNLAELGVILLMFLAGLETDLAAMKKVGLAALIGALGGVALPFFGGLGVALPFGYDFREAVFIGTVLTATSVSITAQTLIELKALRSKEGTTILGAAVIDDVMGIIVLSLVIALYGTGSGAAAGAGSSPLMTLGVIALRIVVFFVVFALVLGRFAKPVLEWARKRLQTAEVVGAMTLALVFIYAWAAEYIGGVAAITGSYLLGVLIGQTDIKHQIESKMQTIAYSLLVPIFFLNIGLHANGRELLGPNFEVTMWIVLVAILAKIIGAGLGVMVTGFKPMESLRVGIGMVSRGEVALIVSSIGLRSGVIGPEVFSIMVIMTLISTLVTPILLRLVFPKPKEVGAAA